MKRVFVILTAVCLLLSGCAAQQAAEPPAQPLPEAEEAAAAQETVKAVPAFVSDRPLAQADAPEAAEASQPAQPEEPAPEPPAPPAKEEVSEPEPPTRPEPPAPKPPEKTEPPAQPAAEEPAPAPQEEPAEPPAPTAADAAAFIGRSVSSLYAAIGMPLSASYAPSCLRDTGEDGELVYNGFTVYTYRDGDTETVQDVM